MATKTSFLRSPNLRAFLWIALLALIVFSIFSQPRLLQDDWTLILSDGVFERTSWFDWYQQRPLNATIYKAAFALFGVNITAYYWFNCLVVVGIYYLIYLLINQFLDDLKPIALLSTVLAMVYPAYYTTTWLTMINNHLSWLLTLWGMWLLSGFALREGKWWQLTAGSILLFLPLWSYEATLGIAAAWCIFLLAITFVKPYPTISAARRLTLLIPLVLLGLFAVLRIVVRPMLGIRGLNSGSVSELTPAMLFERALEVKVLAKAWTDPLARLFANMGFSISQFWTLVALGFLVLIVLFIVKWLLSTRVKLTVSGAGEVFEQRIALRRLAWTMVTALGFIVAGMIPMVLIRPLNLEDITTRANLYAIPAAALVITSLLGMIALLLVDNRRSWQWLLWSGAIPLLLIGLSVQFHIQQKWQDAWEKQQMIWQSIFRIAPNFQDGTTVVLVMQGYQKMGWGQHPPIYAEWEFDDALKVLYNNPTLEGRILFPKADFFSEARLEPDGVHGAYLSETSPYHETVFFIFREAQNKVQLLENPHKIIQLPFSLQDYQARNRILEDNPPPFQHRQLVGEE